jgi:hypothetical protein
MDIMKVKIILKKSALQKLALTKTIRDHTGCGLTEAKFAVDELHHIPYRAIEFEFDVSKSVYRDPVNSFLVSLDVLGLEYESNTVEQERERKMMELGLAEREEYIAFLSGENPFHKVDTGMVVRMVLDGMCLEDLKEIFDRINSKKE